MLRPSDRAVLLAAVLAAAGCITPRPVEPGSPLASGGAADKPALIRELLALSRSAELAVTAIEASIPAQRAANPRIPGEFWDEFAARARRDMPRFVDVLVPVYAAHYDEAQLEQLVAFYKSPVGRHLVKVQPEITLQSMQAGEKWGATLGAEVAQDLVKRGVKFPSQ